MNARRDPIGATRRANRAGRMTRQRQSMSLDRVEAAMRKIIRERLGDDELISLDDFARANLPMDMVKARFKALLARVQNSLAMERA